MDNPAEEFPGSMNKFKFKHGSVVLCSNQNLLNGFEVNHEFVHEPFLATNPQHPSDASPSLDTSLDGDCSFTGDPNVILKYINEMLMEEDLQAKPCMLQDCLALQAAEKSFYEVLCQEDPPSTYQLPPYFDQNIEGRDANVAGRNSIDSSNSYNVVHNLVKSNWNYDERESKSFCIQTSFFDSPSKNFLLPEERNKSYTSPDGSSRRKNHQREDTNNFEEERSNKHPMVYAGEFDSKLLEMFDKILNCPQADSKCESSALHESAGNGGRIKLQHNNHSRGYCSKNQGDKGEKMVDFQNLLTQCAKAVASSDKRTANEVLKQIREHSSPFGDGFQRLAHYFANALEARLAGTGIPVYTPLVSNGTSAADILKAYQVYVTACPFMRMSNYFANRTIGILAQARKATRIHIIDFGILYGLQWPCLIERLAIRPDGPPKLRITGIELPQPGFRPAERVEKIGRRLQNYCKRLNVPFEYNVIAQKWETIQLEDLKIDKNELIVVNCLYWLKNIPNETVAIDCPRDTVLKLIKRIDPDLFVHGVVNGTYNAPYFVTRFREALFHFYALFDMFDANVPCEDHQRLQFEKEIFGRDAMNVIACEGLERVERPESYKQWQVRNLRAGFKQLPIDEELLQNVKNVVKSEYHKDFVMENDGQWMLQGWKGRIVHAISSWRPS